GLGKFFRFRGNQETLKMLQIALRLLVCTAMAPMLIGSFGRADDAGQSHSFKFVIEAQLKMKIQGVERKMDTDTSLHYTRKRSDKQRIISFDSMLVKVNQDGMQSMNVYMSRAKLTNSTEGKTDEVKFENAPDELKKILQDTFSVPLCKLQVDENGKEIK